MVTSSGHHLCEQDTLSCNLGQNPERSQGCVGKLRRLSRWKREQKQLSFEIYKGKYTYLNQT